MRVANAPVRLVIVVCVCVVYSAFFVQTARRREMPLCGKEVVGDLRTEFFFLL